MNGMLSGVRKAKDPLAEIGVTPSVPVVAALQASERLFFRL